MCCRQNVIVIDEWPAAKLSATIEQHSNPWPFMWTGILSANNALLILISIFRSAIIADVTLHGWRWRCRLHRYLWHRLMRWQRWWPWISTWSMCCRRYHDRFECCVTAAWQWSGNTWMRGRRMIRWMGRKRWWPIIHIHSFINCCRTHAIRRFQRISTAHAERLSAGFCEKCACVILTEHPSIENTKIGHFLEIWIATFEWFASTVFRFRCNAYTTFAHHISPCCDRTQSFVAYGTCFALCTNLFRCSCVIKEEEKKRRKIENQYFAFQAGGNEMKISNSFISIQVTRQVPYVFYPLPVSIFFQANIRLFDDLLHRSESHVYYCLFINAITTKLLEASWVSDVMNLYVRVAFTFLIYLLVFFSHLRITLQLVE